jgi:hypothetical protein
VAIARFTIHFRASVQDVADINLFPRQAYGGNDPGQQLTSSTNKGNSLYFFIGTGRFAAKENFGIQIIYAKN